MSTGTTLPGIVSGGFEPEEMRGVVAIEPMSPLPAGNLILGQKRGRTLPVASARFALQFATGLKDHHVERSQEA